MKIRKYKSDDYKEVVELFHNTIHSICSGDYNKNQLDAWAPTPIDYQKWKDRLNKSKPILATTEDRIIGFAEIENGHIDCFYVHRDYQGQGVGTFLLNELVAISKNTGKLQAEVSITAKPFFLNHGFEVVKENSVQIDNETLVNFTMEKNLS